MVPNLDSFWQDSPHAIRDLMSQNQKGPQPFQAIPVTADVSALYSNIPQQQGMEKFREALDNPKLRPQPKLPTVFLMMLLSFVLTFNVFIFNGHHFLQRIGTAMVTRVAPTFACIFMGWLETQILATWLETKPHLWRRYIDDIFFLWYGTEEELLRFIEHCNTAHKTIKFTFNYDFKTRSVDFLDIHIWIDYEGWIQTDLFQKDVKKCQLLLPSSAHPGHCSRSIPYSIGYRLRRLCIMVTDDESAAWLEHQDLRHRRKPTVPGQLVSRLEDQLVSLKGRGYKHKQVLDQFQKALEISRQVALEKVNSVKKENGPILSLPYDRRMPNITSILHQHWLYLLKVNPDLKRVLPKPPMVSYTRPKNLRDILVRSKLPGQPKSKSLRRRVGFKKCNMVRCETCPYTRNISVHTSNFSRKSYPIKEELSCFTKNTIYSITCTKGSGSFIKKSGNKTNSSPSTGSSASNGQHVPICPLAGSSTLDGNKTNSSPSTGSSTSNDQNVPICPLAGSSKMDGKDLTLFPHTGKSKKMSCPNEGQYIGMTSQQFRDRMVQHRRSVSPFLGQTDAKTPVGYHFSLPGHSLQHMQFVAIEQVKSQDPYVILARESLWIRIYQSINHGLNTHQ